MIESRNHIISTPKNATTDTGEPVVLILSRNEEMRRIYAGEGVSGIIRRWIGKDAAGELYMGNSLKKLRRVTKDAPAAASVIRGLSE